jgi:phospholipid transport system substrate-binding protein
MKTFKILAVTIIVLLFCQVRAYAAGQPIVQIKATVDQAISLLNDKALQGAAKHDARQSRLFKLVDQRFDFPLMGRLALGRAWAGADRGERQRFVHLFAQLLKNTYIRRVDSYAAEKIIFKKQIVRKDLALVYSYYDKNNEKFSINYKMKRNNDGQWLVFDVVIEGVSVVKQYRQQFQEILKNESMQALNKRLADKVKALVRAVNVAS